MQSSLDRKLLVVAGKGGVGKSTMAAALGLAGARAGRRTIVVEVGQENRVPHIFGVPAGEPGEAVKVGESLWSMSIDPDRALLEWLQALGGRVSGRLLASSGTFQYFAAAAPGAKELVTMVKIWRLTRDERRGRRGGGGYELVVLDAPATGHALGLLSSPQTFGAIARVGPIAGQTRHVQELLQDPEGTAFVAVALGTDMAVTEALELQDGLERELGRSLSAVIVNGLLPKRFTAKELSRIEAMDDGGGRAGEPSLTHAAARAARAVHERSRLQQNQMARLRRRSIEVVGVPFVWSGELKLTEVGAIAERLAQKL